MENQPANPGETLWRRKLSEAERNALRTRPELDLEARLTAALAKIPDAPVPSNFTARVLAAVELDEAAAARSRGWAFLHWRRLCPRVAVVAAILIFAGANLQWHDARSQRAALARSVALVAAQPAPSVDALENLDTIQRMSRPARADGELLAALQ
jgi:hypothetical protein